MNYEDLKYPVDAEQALLGAILLKGRILKDLLNDPDFHEPMFDECYLYEIANLCPTVSNYKEYAHIILCGWEKREEEKDKDNI